ncbi:hypothetical protein MPSEU_000059200 [Mayamaea pseudoterrestris]|nr:hypothetical protein MPSEU_000059200 [Mayamaea pseudoterrestris]
MQNADDLGITVCQRRIETARPKIEQAEMMIKQRDSSLACYVPMQCQPYSPVNNDLQKGRSPSFDMRAGRNIIASFDRLAVNKVAIKIEEVEAETRMDENANF